ncbi:MAG: LysR family transcriptional regulator [Oscillospiraceae bacterium]|nr:LysR family transcriptional regulator [Oscillospiraceae bacterium]
MNLLHLKYAVVIAETNSMTKAAEKLYTAQPNLSRAVRELESTLGVTIFKRTPQGIYPTAAGEEFLGYARKILAQVDAVEAMYQGERKSTLRFSVSVPRASYIACAFTEFIKDTKAPDGADIFYKETNALRAVNNIVDADYRLGIIRYQDIYDANFHELLAEKKLRGEVIFEFNYLLLFSKEHPLAEKQDVSLSDLRPYTEIAHADPFVPSLPLSTVRKNELSDTVDRHIFVFERGSQMDLLSEARDTFMWVSPVPQRLLDRYSLVQRPCAENTRRYKDVLIYKQGYALTDADKLFIDKLMQVKRTLPQ